MNDIVSFPEVRRIVVPRYDVINNASVGAIVVDGKVVVIRFVVCQMSYIFLIKTVESRSPNKIFRLSMAPRK